MLSALLAVAFVVVVSLLVAELRAEPRSGLPSVTGPTLVAQLDPPPVVARPRVRGGASFGAVPSAPVEAPTPVEHPPIIHEEPPHPTIADVLDVDEEEADSDTDSDDLDFDGRVPQQVIIDGPHEITIGRRVIRIESELIIY